MSNNVLLLNALIEENRTIRTYFDEAHQRCLREHPENPANWRAMPLLSKMYDDTQVLEVCGTDGLYRAEAYCEWTVPEGVSIAHFQIWGAGAGTTGGMCCGGSNFGDSGAYATVLTSVTPGDTYNLCAGCATECWARAWDGVCSQQGCKSYVTGPGLNNVCAEGGMSGMLCVMNDLWGGRYNDSAGNCCRHTSPVWGDAGGCLCQGGGHTYCFSNSCSTCHVIDTFPAKRTFYGSADNGFVMGVPSLHGGWYYSTDHYGWHFSPPVVDKTHQVAPSSGDRVCYSSETCMGGCLCTAAQGVFLFPGSGGYFSHVMGGGYTTYGDTGRFGMVRVMYR